MLDQLAASNEIGGGLLEKDEGLFAVEDHVVVVYQLESCTEVDAKLGHVAEGNRYLLVVSWLIDWLDLSRFIRYSQLEKRLVNLLALGAEEDVEQIIDDPGLPLQEDALRELSIGSLLGELFLDIPALERVRQRLLKHPILKLDLLILFLQKLVDALRALDHVLLRLQFLVPELFLSLDPQGYSFDFLSQLGLGELVVLVQLNLLVEVLLNLPHVGVLPGLGDVVPILVLVKLEEVVDKLELAHVRLVHVELFVEAEVPKVLLHHHFRVK